MLKERRKKLEGGEPKPTSFFFPSDKRLQHDIKELCKAAAFFSNELK